MPPGNPGETHLDRFEIHKRFRNRLERTQYVDHVRARPSPMLPTRVVATIDTERWFGSGYRVDSATLEVDWRPRTGRDWFRIQYTESAANWSCGWHQDSSHEELGPNHFQIDCAAGESSRREPGTFDDPNPMAVLEYCLSELERRVPELPADVRLS